MHSAKTKPTRCSYGDESAYTSPQSYTLPSTQPDEPAWIADPTLSYETPDDFPVNEEPETEGIETQEPETDEFDLIGDLFSDPISVVVPVSDENPTETPEISILPENPTLEQLKEATKKVPPTCAGITAAYVCGTHDATPTYSGESISITAGDELAMNSLVLTIVEIDGSGNGMGTIKLPMLNGARVGLKLSGIQAVKGGCIVAGRAELGGVPMLNLDAKLKENLESLAMGLQVIGLAGQEYATEIANGINATVAKIEELGKKLTEKKRNTQALLAANDLTQLDASVSNCNEIATDSKAMMDSLTSLICKVKEGTLKANLKDLEKSLNKNKAFMDKLGPALAECPNSNFTPWEEKPCSGPCAFEWYAVNPECQQKLNPLFGVDDDCYCDNLIEITSNPKYKGSKIGDELTIKNCVDLSILGTGSIPTLRRCNFKLYYFKDENNIGKWYKKPEFEDLILPYVKAVALINDGGKHTNPIMINGSILGFYQTIEEFQRRGISKNFQDITFSTNLKEKVQVEFGRYNEAIYPYFIEFDIAFFLEAPILKLGKYLTTVSKAAYLLPTAGAKTATLYYVLNNSERKLVANLSKIAAFEELQFLGGTVAKREVLIELKKVKYIDPKGIEKTGNITFVKDGAKYGWVEVNGAGELVGKYEWGLVKRYFQHIQDVTGRAVGQKQIDKLKDALRAKEYTRLSPTEVEKHRRKFTTSVKNRCIADWERETGQVWPKYTEVVYDKNGDVYKKIGDVYDAHHIIENKFEGPHEWWNIHPAKFPDEHQSGIHGVGSPANELFK